MIELKGKYAEAKIFTDVVEKEAISQVIEFLNQPYAQGCTIRLMPDIHAGASCVIGTTATVKDKICPNIVGVDIGCGMYTVKIKEKSIDLDKLDEIIRQRVPSGFDVRSKPHKLSRLVPLEELYCVKYIDIIRAENSIGTLGGGNHFIEVDKDDEGNLYIVIHSGSRHLGVEVAKYYQKAAYEALTTYSITERKAIVAKLKSEGRHSEIQQVITSLGKKATSIQKEFAYVEGELLDRYLHDMAIAQTFATVSRKTMMQEIIDGLGLTVEEEFTTIHNYVDMEHRILRKGAVSAQKGEKLLIPINMRDGSLICIGKGNPDWNFSAPHGAGRLFSRSAAKETFSLEEYQQQMEGIYTTCVDMSTIDESPMAYKKMADIVDNITPTAEIISVIRPIYNFKAGT